MSTASLCRLGAVVLGLAAPVGSAVAQQGPQQVTSDETARRACLEQARNGGYASVQVLGTAPDGRMVTVRLRGSRQGQQSDLACTYLRESNSAVLNQQSFATPREAGMSSELFKRARAACEALAQQQGYEVAGIGQARQSPDGVRYSMPLRRASTSYPGGSCTYFKRGARAVLAPGAPSAGTRPH